MNIREYFYDEFIHSIVAIVYGLSEFHASGKMSVKLKPTHNNHLGDE